jgi:hypothetical protein
VPQGVLQRKKGFDTSSEIGKFSDDTSFRVSSTTPILEKKMAEELRICLKNEKLGPYSQNPSL